MTTPPADHSVDTAFADPVFAERCDTSGQYIAGLLAAGMLNTVGRPSKLPELLFPDVDPWIVRQIWEAALPVGVWVGKALTRPWDQEGIDRLRAALADAGYDAMAKRADRTANHRQPPAAHGPPRRHRHHGPGRGPPVTRPTRGRGRPARFDDTLRQQYLDAVTHGMRLGEAAAHLNIHPNIPTRHARTDPEFGHALTEARALGKKARNERKPHDESRYNHQQCRCTTCTAAATRARASRRHTTEDDDTPGQIIDLPEPQSPHSLLLLKAC